MNGQIKGPGDTSVPQLGVFDRMRETSKLDAPSGVLGKTALATTVSIAAASAFGPGLLRFPYWAIDLATGLSPPNWSAGHYLGTDLLGRDQLARILQGGRISLTVAIVGTLVAGLIGIPYGAIAGWIGGRLDGLMMRFVDLLYTIPYMFLAILVMALVGGAQTTNWQRMVVLFGVLGSVSWLTTARIVRGQVLSLKSQVFVEAARATGVSHSRIIVRHLLPNLAGVMLVFLTLTAPSVVLQEAFLSFLGLGVRPPMASWGTLLNDGMQAVTVAPWLLVGPALFLVLTILSLNVLGDWLRDLWERR